MGRTARADTAAARRSPSITDLAATIQTVTAGRNNMPPFSSALTPQEVRDVSAYVLQALSGRVP